MRPTIVTLWNWYIPLVAVLLGDLGRGEEWLAVLLVAEGGVPVPPLDEAVQDEVEVGLLHRIEDLFVPGLPGEGLLRTHQVRLGHHLLDLLGVVEVMAPLSLVVDDMEVVDHMLCRHPDLVLGWWQCQRFLDQPECIYVVIFIWLSG